MNSSFRKYGLWAVRGLLTLAFLAAGTAKLMGVAMMVATFDAIGIGQWFRYLTAIIEVGGAVLLWVPGAQAIAAGLLTCTMIGAVLSHLFILGPSAVPATVLGVLAALTLFAYRGQLKRA
jgi:uncharacterized membrane protein YphA (DoxX/SURF4 family)